MIGEPFYSNNHHAAKAIEELLAKNPNCSFPQLIILGQNSNLLLLVDGKTDRDILFGTAPSIGYRFVWDGSISGQYRGYNCGITIEEFVNYLEEKNPDYLEWFLFHPELI